MKLLYDGGWRIVEGEQRTRPYITPSAAQKAAERGVWDEPVPEGYYLIVERMGRPVRGACKRCKAPVCRAESPDGYVIAEWDARREVNGCQYAPAHVCRRRGRR